MEYILFFIKKVRHQFFNSTSRKLIKLRNLYWWRNNISFLTYILSGAKGWLLCNLRNSLGYSRSASKTQPFELLLVYLFNPDSLGSLYFKCLVARTLGIAQPYKLFTSKCITGFDSCMTRIVLINLTLILQFLCAKPLSFPVIWQIPVTLTSPLTLSPI